MHYKYCKFCGARTFDSSGWLDGVCEDCYKKREEQGHESKTCSRNGCDNEATRWYEQSGLTIYVCTEHPDIEQAEEKGTIVNNEGKEVELAVYQCKENCEVCND